jgi:hypothetical protein
VKNIKEIYQALLDGETLTYGNGTLIVNIGNAGQYAFSAPEDWEIYEDKGKMKDKIAKDAIKVGLNLCSKINNVDASPVIPSLVGKVLEDIGECSTCAGIDGTGICRDPEGMFDQDMSDRLWFWCAAYKLHQEPRITNGYTGS